MAEEKSKYSLWLVPKGGVGMALQDLIGKLAGQYQAPKFVPHVTLVANVFADSGELEDLKVRVGLFAERMNQFTVELTNYAYLDEEFRSLYLLAQSPELRLAYDQALQVFPQVRDEHFQKMPHLSVLYGDYPSETKEQIIESSPWAGAEFVVESIDLYLTNNPVEDWRLVQSFPLKPL